jgi:hypothetical protein
MMCELLWHVMVHVASSETTGVEMGGTHALHMAAVMLPGDVFAQLVWCLLVHRVKVVGCGVGSLIALQKTGCTGGLSLFSPCDRRCRLQCVRIFVRGW